MTPKTATVPDLSANSPLHQAAREKGVDHFFSSWQYNVADHLKHLSTQDIKNHLRSTCFPFAVCVENLLGDFNFSTVVRNANAFNFREVFYLGLKRVDKRGMVGVQNYTDIHFLPTIEDFIALKQHYRIVGVDNVPGAQSLSAYRFSPNSLFVFGEEGCGLTPGMQKLCDEMICISQFGSVRSINVGCASAIILNAAVQSHQTGNSKQ